MKRRWTVLVFLVLGPLTAWLIVVAQSSTVVIPFATTTTINAWETSGSSRSLTAFIRKIDGTYAEVKYNRSAPHSVLTALVTLNDVLSPGLAALLAAPAGPPNVGPAAQFGAGGKFTAAGALGGAYLPYFNLRTQLRTFVRSGSFLDINTAIHIVGPRTGRVLAADFNGDTVLDIAVTNQGDFNGPAGYLAIYINRGDGTFLDPVTYPAGTRPVSLAAFDLNKDSRLDLAVADSNANTIHILLGRADGTFQPGSTATAGANINSVTIGDFNGDGNMDLASVAADGALVSNLGNGDGTFRAGSTLNNGINSIYIAAGDFNNDSRLDLVTASITNDQATVFLGNGSGGFQHTSAYALSYSPDTLVLTDFNRDGKLDIVNAIGDARAFGASSGSGNVDILLGNGDGTFQGVPVTNTGERSVTFVAAADFSGDGRIDAVTNDHFSNNLFYFPSNANGTLAASPTLLNLGTGGQVLPSDAVAGDFNSDGRPDLAVTEGDEFSGPHRVAILLNNGSGSFQAPATFASGANGPTAIVAARLDADANLDLAVANTASGRVAIFRGGGNGAFQLLQTYATGTKPGEIAVADVNGDSRQDLIVLDRGSPLSTPAVAGGIHVLVNNGDASFQARPGFPVNIGPTTVGAGDVNNDGRVDIVTGISDPDFNNYLGVSLGNGDGTFRAATLVPADFGPSAVAVRDFDLDGRADIVMAHCCGETDTVYRRGNGDGTFSAEAHFITAPSPSALQVVDANGDNAPDLVAGGSEGSVAIVLNKALRITHRHSASFVAGTLAPDMIATSEAANIAPSLIVAQSTPWPAELGGVRIEITDSQGRKHAAPIYYVSPTAASYLVPPEAALGQGSVSITTSTGTVVTGPATIARLAPGLYSANSTGSGAAAAFYLRVQANGNRTEDYIFDLNTRAPVPIDLGPQGEQVYLLLYGTGFRAQAGAATAIVGGIATPILGTAAHSIYQGLDQVNIGPLPRGLAGRGVSDIVITFEGHRTNPVTVNIR